MPTLHAQVTDETVIHRISIILPFDSVHYQSAAIAVESGILAAQAANPSPTTVLTFYGTGDRSAQIRQIYLQAVKNADYVIGPLLRNQVQQLLMLPSIPIPTITLSMLNTDHHARITKPNMMMMGISLEDEASQLAQWIAGSAVQGGVYLIGAETLWQQRMMHAFKQQAHSDGLTVKTIQFAVHHNQIDEKDILQLKTQIQKDHPAAIVMATNHMQTIQLLKQLPKTIPVWGTSALNLISDHQQHQAIFEGIRFLDIPAQTGHHHMVMRHYTMPDQSWPMVLYGDQFRLYALGVDAYRVVSALIRQSHVEIAGMTGDLTINLGQGGVTYFQRAYQRFIYQNGQVIPEDEINNS